MEDAKLKAYRDLGLARLEQLLLELSDQPHDADRFVDRAIRQLTNLPPAPANAPPYQGIYSSSFTMEQYRNGATSRLLELMQQKLPKLDPLDEEVDRYIRVLSDLPACPAGTEPYARLFVLREDMPDPVVVNASVSFAPQKQFVTLDQMLNIIGSTKLKDRVTAMIPGINLTLDKFEINTPLRIAHFLGQVLHESGGFRYLREIWGPTDAQKRYEPPSSLATRLGNTQKGDGARYMGRGVIQLTGRSNYAQFSKAMGVDFVAHPELVESPQYAVTAAGWYWSTRKINQWADKDDLLKVTRLVNGGTNGLADREKYMKKAKQVLGVK
jgi:putative chitinase